jgi:hypothetical protein
MLETVITGDQFPWEKNAFIISLKYIMVSTVSLTPIGKPVQLEHEAYGFY